MKCKYQAEIILETEERSDPSDLSKVFDLDDIWMVIWKPTLEARCRMRSIFFIISASCCGRPDSHDVNENLSQQRAESVRQYLLANKTLSYEKIVAVGYGSKRPLASNATPKGRAVNRRIDGIIKPKPSTVGFDIRILHENWRNLPTAIYREIHYW